MEDMAEKTNKGLPVELDPDNTGVRKSFVILLSSMKKEIFFLPHSLLLSSLHTF